MVQKQTYRSTEQDRKHRNKPTYLWSITLDKGDKTIKWEKVCSATVLEKLDSACKSVKLEHTLTPCTKINSKWLKDLNTRHDTIKLLEESIGKTFSDINRTNIFLGSVSKGNRNKNKSK